VAAEVFPEGVGAALKLLEAPKVFGSHGDRAATDISTIFIFILLSLFATVEGLNILGENISTASAWHIHRNPWRADQIAVAPIYGDKITGT
jgi:hypothetical protein